MVLDLGSARFTSSIDFSGVIDSLKDANKSIQSGRGALGRAATLKLKLALDDATLRQLSKDLTKELATGDRSVAGRVGKASGETFSQAFAKTATTQLRKQSRSLTRDITKALSDPTKSAGKETGETLAESLTSAFVNELKKELGDELADAITDATKDARRGVERSSERLAEQSADAYLAEIERQLRDEIGEAIAEAVANARRDTERANERLAQQGSEAFTEETQAQLRQALPDAITEAIEGARASVENSSEALGRRGAAELSQRLEQDLRSQLPDIVSDAILAARIESEQAAGRVGAAAGDEYANEFEQRLRRDLDGAVAAGIRSARGDGERAAGAAGARAGDSYADAFERNSTARAGSVGDTFGGGFGTGMLGTASATATSFVGSVGPSLITGIGSAGLNAGVNFGEFLIQGVIDAIATINGLVVDSLKFSFDQIQQSVELGAGVDRNIILAETLAGGKDDGTIEGVQSALESVAANPDYVIGPVALSEAVLTLAKSGAGLKQIEGTLDAIGQGVSITGENTDRFTNQYLDFTASFALGADEQSQALKAVVASLAAAKQELNDFSLASKYINTGNVGLTAALEEAVLISSVASAGIRGSSAGVGLNEIFNPKRFLALGETLNVGVSDADLQSGNQVEAVKKLVAAYNQQIEELRATTGEGSDAILNFEKDLRKATGERGGRVFAALGTIGVGGIEDIESQIANSEATVDSLFEALSTRVGRGADAIENSVEAARLTISSAFAGLFDTGGVAIASFLDDIFKQVSFDSSQDSGFGFLAQQVKALEDVLSSGPISAYFTDIKDAIAGLVNSGLEIVGGIFEDIAGYLEDGDNARQFAENIKFLIKVVQTAIETIAKLYTTFGKSVYDIITEATNESLGGSIDFVDLSNRVSDIIGEFIKASIPILAPVISQATGALFGLLFAAMAPRGTAFGNVVREIGDDLAYAFGPLVQPLTDFFNDNGQAIITFLNASWNIIIGIIQTLSRAVAVGVRLANALTRTLLPTVNGILIGTEAVVIALKVPVDFILQTVEFLIEDITKLINYFANAQDDLNSFLNTANDTSQKLIDGFLDYRTFKDRLITFFENAILAMVEGLEKAADVAANYLSRKLNELLDLIGRFLGFGDTSASTEGVLVASGDLYGIIDSAAFEVQESLTDRIFGWIPQQLGNLKTKAGELIKGIFAPVKQYLEESRQRFDAWTADTRKGAELLDEFIRLKLRQFREWIAGQAEDIKATVIDKVTEFRDNAIAKLEEFRDNVLRIVKTLRDDIVAFGNRGIEIFTGWGTALATGLTEALPILTKLEGFINRISGATSKFASGLADTFSSLKDKVSKNVGGVIGGISSKIKAVTGGSDEFVPVSGASRGREQALSRQFKDEAIARGFIPVSGSSLAQDLVNNPKIKAFLDTIAYAEGTSGANGYTTQFTGTQFSDFSRHPRELRSGGGYTSDAAGRYQFLSTTYAGLQSRLGLPDFSPRSQDIAAVQLLIDNGAIADILSGAISSGIDKVADVWASLPTLSGGSVYGQPIVSGSTLRNIYSTALSTGRVPARGPSGGGAGATGGLSLPTLPTGTLAAQAYGHSRDGGARQHAGLDFDLGPNDSFPSLLGGVVTRKGYDASGYGNYIDIYNAQSGLVERIAELDSLSVAVGDRVASGQIVGRGTKQTGVVHVEYRDPIGSSGQGGFGFSGTYDPTDILTQLGLYAVGSGGLVPTGNVLGSLPTLSHSPDQANIDTLRNVAGVANKGFSFNLPSIKNAINKTGAADGLFQPISGGFSVAERIQAAIALGGGATINDQIDRAIAEGYQGGYSLENNKLIAQQLEERFGGSFEIAEDGSYGRTINGKRTSNRGPFYGANASVNEAIAAGIADTVVTGVNQGADAATDAISEFFGNRGFGASATFAPYATLADNLASSFDGSALATLHSTGAIAQGSVLLGTEYDSASNRINNGGLDALAQSASGVTRNVGRLPRAKAMTFDLRGVKAGESVDGNVIQQLQNLLNSDMVQEQLIGQVFELIAHSPQHQDVIMSLMQQVR